MTPAALAQTDGYPSGPSRLILLGPPGTGKTRAALERWLVPCLRTYPPNQVLAISFSRAAAGELRERLVAALGGEAKRFTPCARTIHSEAWRLLREGGYDCDLHEEPEDLAEEVHEAVKLERRRAALQLHDLARHRRDQDLRTAFRLIRPVGHTLAELQASLACYQREKGEGAIDYTDLLEHALTAEPPARQLLILDEAQDCSRLQWELVERWASKAARVVLIGDPDQAVHRWAGACPERLLEHARGERFAVRRLARSHRVPRGAHRLAVGLIRRNRDRIDAAYEPAEQPGRVLELDQAEAVKRIGEAAGSAFVLARSRSILSRWARSLGEAGVAFTNERGYSPLGSPQRAAVARAVFGLRQGDPVDRLDLRELLELLPREFFVGRTKADTVAAFDAAVFASPSYASALGVELKRLRTLPLVSALAVPRTSSTLAGRQRWAQEVARLGTAEPKVTLTTAHACKGREADLVVIDLEAPRLVLRNLDRPGGKDNERQLLYVALTRTRGDLVLVRHARRDLGQVLGLRGARGSGELHAHTGEACPCQDKDSAWGRKTPLGDISKDLCV